MPGALDAGDRTLLIGGTVFLLVLVTTAAVLSPQPQSQQGGASSYSPAWGGSKAAYLLLESQGYKIERWEKPPMEIRSAPQQTVVVFAEPLLAPSAEEQQALRQFLGFGGRILTAGGTTAAFLPEAEVGKGKRLVTEWKHQRALLPSPIAAGAPEIVMPETVHWKPGKASHLAVYGEPDRAVVVTYRFGQGRVIWWASAVPLTNGGIRQASNLALLLDSLGPPGETRVLWDEYYHGMRGSLLTYFGGTPLPWIAAQLALLFLAALVSFSRACGPRRAPYVELRLSPLEFVETLGDLYATAHAGTTAVRVAYQRFRFLLARRLGVPVHANAREMAEAAERQLGWPRPALVYTMGQAERAMRRLELEDREALELVERLHEHIERLERPRRKRQETFR